MHEHEYRARSCTVQDIQTLRSNDFAKVNPILFLLPLLSDPTEATSYRISYILLSVSILIYRKYA